MLDSLMFGIQDRGGGGGGYYGQTPHLVSRMHETNFQIGDEESYSAPKRQGQSVEVT